MVNVNFITAEWSDEATHTWTPPSGEVYYVKEVRYYVDGSGNTGTGYVAGSVWPSGASPGSYHENAFLGGERSTLYDCYAKQNFAQVLDGYINDNFTVYTEVQNANGANFQQRIVGWQVL